MSTTTYLINKCPSSGIGGDIPDEKWYGSEPDYSRLRPFGCKAFAHQKQGKLNARAIQCIMLGYPNGVKGYRLWSIEPGKERVLISRYVVFIEDKMPFLMKNSEDQDHAPAEEFCTYEPDA